MTAPFQPYTLVLHEGANPRTGGIAICGFTNAGMVGVISTSHIIRALDLQQQGTVLNESFPAVALVQDEVPKHPVRIYQGDGIGVFTSEIKFEDDKDISLATTVLEWFIKGGFNKLYVIDGIISQDKDMNESMLYGVGSSPATRASLKEIGIETIRSGVVSGITGFLLGEGDRLGLDVTALLSEASPIYPDARSAAIAIEALTELTGLEIPLGELLENARIIEDSVRDMFEKQSTNILSEPKINDDPSFG